MPGRFATLRLDVVSHGLQIDDTALADSAPVDDIPVSSVSKMDDSSSPGTTSLSHEPLQGEVECTYRAAALDAFRAAIGDPSLQAGHNILERGLSACSECCAGVAAIGKA